MLPTPTRRWTRACATFLLVGALAPACGNSTTPPDAMPTDTGPDGWGIPTSVACGDLAMAVCERIQTCSNGFEMLRRFGSMQGCISRYAQQCLVQLTVPSSSLSPLLQDTCATATTMQSCSDWRAGLLPTACVPAAGPLPDGTQCILDAQCHGGACVIPGGGQCGTCGAPVAEGGACDGAPCASGLVCFAEASGSSHVCRRPVALGGVCDATHPCVAGGGCVVATAGGTSGMCQALGAMAGAPCAAGSVAMPDCDAFLGLFCNSSGTCARVTTAAAGDSCMPASGTAPAVICTNSANCVSGSGGMSTCVAPAMDGQPCDLSTGHGCQPLARCLAPAGVDGGSAVCVATDPRACHL